MWKLQCDFVDPAFRNHMQPLIAAAAKTRQRNIRQRYDQLMEDEVGSKT
jgi:hypothetical protein